VTDSVNVYAREYRVWCARLVLREVRWRGVEGEVAVEGNLPAAVVDVHLADAASLCHGVAHQILA
jgi:hypothetical protein